MAELDITGDAKLNNLFSQIDQLNNKMSDTEKIMKMTTGATATLGMAMGNPLLTAAGAATDQFQTLAQMGLNLASMSPEVQTAMAGLNMQLFEMGIELGPAAGRAIEAFSKLLEKIPVVPALQWTLDTLTAIIDSIDRLISNKPQADIEELQKELGRELTPQEIEDWGMGRISKEDLLKTKTDDSKSSAPSYEDLIEAWKDAFTDGVAGGIKINTTNLIIEGFSQ